MAGLQAAGNTMAEKPDIMLVDDAERDGPSDNPEKAPSVRVVDSFHVLGLTDDDAEFYNNYTPEQRARTKRKVCTEPWMKHKDMLMLTL